MKKKTSTPATTNEAPRLLPAAHRYVLLRDGGIARRIRSYNICGTDYYTVTINGNPQRIKAAVLAAYLSQPSN
jgi:hypothetical protein